jgi:hypothetical protein
VLDTDRKGLPGSVKNGGDGGTGVYMPEETTSRVMAADRPYGKFYDFYRVSPEYVGCTLVCLCLECTKIISLNNICRLMFAVSHYVLCERETSLFKRLMNKVCALERRWTLKIQIEKTTN